MQYCQYLETNDECYYGKSSENIKKQTISKLEIMKRYVQKWIYATLEINDPSYKYDGLIFIDCMSSSGRYLSSDNIEYEGTSVNVVNHFINASKKYVDKDFFIILNDNDDQSIKCQKCRLRQILEDNFDIGVKYYNLDVSSFLNKITHDEVTFREIWPKNKNYQTLFFYDPYDSDIRWDDISLLLRKLKDSKKRYDFIFTHFMQNDTKRGLKNNISEQKQLKYETTYGVPYDIINKKRNELEPLEYNKYLRNLIIHQMTVKLGIQERLIAYGPVFSSSNNAIYDIVLYSPSIKGKIILKELMYKEFNHDDSDIVHHYAIDFGDEVDYTLERKEISERSYFYSVKTYAKIIIDKFKHRGQVDREEVYRFMSDHSFIPLEGMKTAIKKELEKHDVKIKGSSFYFTEIDEKYIVR